MIALSFMLAMLLLRVAWVQVVRGSWYQQKASEQQNKDREITPKRGIIYDRNGKELAISVCVEKIVVNPQEIRKSKRDIGPLSEKLAQLLEMDQAIVLKKLSRKSRYEVLKKRVTKEISDKLRTWQKEDKVVGIYIDEDTKRYYPNRNLATHVIGFVGDDNQGLDGIESTAEQYLKGLPGKILSEVDAGGREVPFNEEKRIEPQNGLNVVLTIDETIQHFTQKVLEKAIDDNKVLKGATAIVMDPRNGDVLALVSKPDFDLNDPKAAPPGVDPATWNGNSAEGIKKLQETVWRNKAVMDTYEPGSTFKAVTSSAGLEENVITPETQVSDATVTVQGWPINCWKPNAHGVESFAEGVYHSCNPVFVKVAQLLGINKFYSYVRAFGLYNKTGIMLPGEAGSIFHKTPTEVDMAAASFGQRFQITPIQLATAYLPIANGGKLLKPRLIKELTDSEGNVVKKFEPEIIRSVISPKTSQTICTILEGVVSKPGCTGNNAYVKGYRIAGKTGTSQTTEAGRYIASFCGFAPADNPVVCALVALDYPTAHSYYGGVIAAPLVGKLIEDTLGYLGIEKHYTEEDKKDLVNKRPVAVEVE